jgi:hypothetical protein
MEPEAMSKGDCFAVAGRLVLEMHLSETSEGSIHLVHGRPRYMGEEVNDSDDGHFWHAWVEVTVSTQVEYEQGKFHNYEMATVIDNSSEKKITIPAPLYYKFGAIKDVTRYTPEEASEKMLLTGHFGPWM